MPKKKTGKRKSDYNPNRMHYLSKDGKYYCYDTTDAYGRTTTIKIEVTPEIEEITLTLDQMDYDEDLSDRYQKRLEDPEFSAKRNRAFAEGEDMPDPIETIADVSHEYDEPSPIEKEVRRIVDTEFTEDQRNLFFEHYGMDKQFKEIREEEAERTGKMPSASAMTSRKDKMINKVAKALGADPPKPRKK